MTCEQKKLLQEINILSFTVVELNLFLDTHPCNQEAMRHFDYYNRLKKFSLLRAYDNCGIDVSDIYDIDNILDTKKKQLQEDIANDQVSLQEYVDPFTGEQVKKGK